MPGTTAPREEPEAVFRFASPGLTVEFEGPETFVVAQLERVLKKVRDEMQKADVGTTGAAPDDEEGEGDVTLSSFHERARSREGRGALQETILIFAYFMREYRGQREFSIESLTACFNVVGTAPPRNLANTLGIMKRNQGLFDSGSARGHYALTDAGMAYVRRLIGA